MQPLSGPLSGPLLSLVLLGALIGLAAARLAGRRKHRRPVETRAAPTSVAPRERRVGRSPGPGLPDPSGTDDLLARLGEQEDRAARLSEENARLEDALQARGNEVAQRTAAMAEAADRDREELVRLQEELEGERRIGAEKARLLRATEAERHRGELTLRRTVTLLRRVRSDRDRQRAAVSALRAALLHAKRGLASAEQRLLRLRDRMRDQGSTERIVEVPVERVVYRDREVPVEVPIEVPVGFTPLGGVGGKDGPAAAPPRSPVSQPMAAPGAGSGGTAGTATEPSGESPR